MTSPVRCEVVLRSPRPRADPPKLETTLAQVLTSAAPHIDRAELVPIKHNAHRFGPTLGEKRITAGCLFDRHPMGDQIIEWESTGSDQTEEKRTELAPTSDTFIQCGFSWQPFASRGCLHLYHIRHVIS